MDGGVSPGSGPGAGVTTVVVVTGASLVEVVAGASVVVVVASSP